MDSERPSHPSNERHIDRPFYLVAAMVLLWIVGMQTFYEASAIAAILREGIISDPVAVAEQNARNFNEALHIVPGVARMAAMAAAPHLTFPLAVAKTLLSSTLVLASTLVLLGRPTARSFALQATLANALFAVIEYVALRNVRGIWVDFLVRASAVITDPTMPAGTAELAGPIAYWLDRFRLVFLGLGVPFLATFALTRARTKVYFAQAAAAAESAEEEP